MRITARELPKSYPELFDILAIGHARVLVGFDDVEASAMRSKLPGGWLQDRSLRLEAPGSLRRHYKRTAGSPPCESVERLAAVLRNEGLTAQAVITWAEHAFDSDVADAWIHLGAQLRVGISDVDPAVMAVLG